MEFVLIGKLKTPKKKIESRIKMLGGKVVAEIHGKLAAVISNEDEIKKMGPKMTLAKTFDIQVVSEDFLTEVEKIDPCRYIICRSLSDWGGNVSFSMILNRIFMISLFFHKINTILAIFTHSTN